MANYFSYTNGNQGYNSMSNGTYQAPAYGSYQQQAAAAAVAQQQVTNQTTPTATAAYITSSNPPVPTQYLSYAQPQQQTAAAAAAVAAVAGATTAGTTNNTAGSTQQQQQQAYQSSYYSTSTPATPSPQQFSKPASYYHQQPSQQQSYYNTGIVLKSEPTTPQTPQQQTQYTVETSSYSNPNTITQQQQQMIAVVGAQAAKPINKTTGMITSGSAGGNSGGAGSNSNNLHMIKQHTSIPQQHHTQSHHQQQQQQQHNNNKPQHNYYQQQQQHSMQTTMQSNNHHSHHHQHHQSHHGHQRNVSNNSNYSQMTNLPYWKQKRLMAQQNKDPNKPIVASEVKAYLYAWLGRYKSRPDYTITPHALQSTRTLYIAELTANGFDYVGKGCAGNKKDAQTRAAWDFIDNLLQNGKIDKKELPTRETKFEATKNRIPASYKPVHYKDDETTRKKYQPEPTAASKETSTATSATNKKAVKAEVIGPKQPDSAALKTGQTVTVKPLMSIEIPLPKKTKKSNNAGANSGAKSAPTAATTTEGAIANKDDAAQGAAGEGSLAASGVVGENYVEQIWTDGRVVRFRCSLCECEFNDDSTKKLHVKGRRHRLNYKQKVDPTIVVEIKLNNKQKQHMMQLMQMEKKKESYYRYDDEMMMRHQYMRGGPPFPPHPPMMDDIEYYRRRGLPVPPPHMRGFAPGGGKFPPKFGPRQVKSKEDDLVMTKHNQIYPKEEELKAVQKLVQIVESSLKKVSEKIHEEEMIVFTARSVHNNSKPAPERLLKSVLRVGSLAKGLLLHNTLTCQLVLVCNEKPTYGMLKRVAAILPNQLQLKCDEMKVDKSEYEMKVEDDEIIVKSTSEVNPKVVCNVYLTSSLMRKPVPTVATTTTTADKEKTTAATDDKKDESATPTPAQPINLSPPDLLNRTKCCQLLAKLRHVKWFQAKASGLHPCVVVIRILKDFCSRIPTWSPLTSWAIELLVQRAISNVVENPLSPPGMAGYITPYMGLSLVFKIISSGLLLEDGSGLLDPCERDNIDVFDNLSPQQKEDITASAQHALRLMAFGLTHEVLGLDEPIEGATAAELEEAKEGFRKRSAENDNDDSKKAKLN